MNWNKSGKTHWYGVKRFFDWLETKAYKMHVRVLLSRYRAYTPCSACDGARLKPESLLWKVEGMSVHDMMLVPVDRLRDIFGKMKLPAPLDEATELLLAEIRSRLRLPAARWAWATSRSTASRARSPAARCSASTSPPRSARRSSTRSSCSTSPPSACTRATWAA